MRKWILRLAVLLAAATGIAALRVTVFALKPIPVRVAVVGRGRVESTVTNSKAGTVKARQRARLAPEIGGRIVEIHHREGERVSRGEVLIRLNDEPQRARLEHARRVLATAQARDEQARVSSERNRRELERNRALAAENVISVDLLDAVESRYEESVRALATAAASVEEARAAIDIAEAELNLTVIRAPFDGVIGDVAVEVGEWVTPSPPMLQAPAVLDLIDTTSIYVSAPMDEVDSAVIHEGMPARVTVDPFPGREFPGRVVRVAPYVLDLEEQNRTVEIEVELDDRKFASTLLPGTSADVEVLLEVREGVPRLPTSALLEGERVYLLEGDRIVERTVRLGLRNWEFAEILEGLEPGERVIMTLDRAEVRPGVRARIEGEGPAGT